MRNALPSRHGGAGGDSATGISVPLADADIREILGRLRRRKWTIVGTTTLLMLVAALIVLQLTPLYRAETQIMIEPRQQRVVDVEEVLSGLNGERETIESERRVIASRALAEKVIARLGLSRDAEFNPALREEHLLLRLLRTFGILPSQGAALGPVSAIWQDLAGAGGIGRPQTPEELFENERARIVDNFLERLEVLPDGRSRVIAVAFTSERPELAARIANTIADLYLVEQLEAKYEATRRAAEWLDERTAELRERVKASEDAVEAFRRQAGLIEGRGGTLATQQVAELNTQLILARTTRAEAEARLRQVQSLLGGQGGVDSAAEVLASPLIVKLKEQEAEIMRRAAELATQYGPKHPRRINVQAELDDIKAKIGLEVQKVVQSLRNEADVARAREASLGASLESLKENVGRASSAEVRLRALEREANANRGLFETFLSRLKETVAQQDLHRADARIISRADVPERPSFPRAGLILAAAFATALIAGVAAALLLERLDPGFRSSEQIEARLNIPGLGSIPRLGGRRSLGRSPESDVLERPASAFAEALRTLHTALLLSDADRPPKTVLITSATPREGKSTVALSIARLTARAGRKVLLIDADLRRPRVDRALRLKTRPGLADLLARPADWQRAIQRDRASGLDVLPAGEAAASPPDLFGSEQMRALLADMGEAYDLVILDSPPVLAVSEARILARLVDRTVFVVRWATTPREVAALGLKQIREAGGQVAGAVLSMVDGREHVRYGYGGPDYYYGVSPRYEPG